MTEQLLRKMQQQYRLAERDRRILIHHLYQWIYDLENEQTIRFHNPPPYMWLEEGINAALDRIQKKYIQRIWIWMRKKVKR